MYDEVLEFILKIFNSNFVKVNKNLFFRMWALIKLRTSDTSKLSIFEETIDTIAGYITE